MFSKKKRDVQENSFLNTHNKLFNIKLSMFSKKERDVQENSFLTTHNKSTANSQSSSKAMATNRLPLKLSIDKKSSSKAMATNKLPLKLLIDKKSNKVLFGDANKEFIDFLFSLMSIPVGSLIHLLSKEKMVGSLGDLYGSIEKLSDTYVQPTQNKNSILKTESAYFYEDDCTLLISNQPTDTVQKEYYYRCSSYSYKTHYAVTNTLGAACPNCGHEMSTEVTFVDSWETKGGGDGYVKEVVTYMVMDNLEVMPMSTISSITLLNKFRVQDVGTLVEKVVYLGMDEGLELLNASLRSKTVLTDVFLSKKQIK